MRKEYELGEEIRAWSINIPDQACDEVCKTLRSGWINTGPKELEFREKLKNRFQANHSVACNSGTSALKLALTAIGIGPGDEVVSTAYSWMATNTAIMELGATPIFADIEYDTLNISPKSVEEKISSRTKAIICVHFGGNSCDLDALQLIAESAGIPLIEDCAHAMGSLFDGLPIGANSQFACFSFQCVKIVTCGDGGAVLCKNEEDYDKVRRLCWYGINRDAKKLSLVDPVPHYPDELGYKMNMNDIVATLAVVAMNHLDEALAQRHEVGQIYDSELTNLSKIVKIKRHPKAIPNYQIYPIHVENRSAFAEFMWKRKIQVNVNNRRNDIYPIFGGIRNDLPDLERADEDTILLPIHKDLNQLSIERILDAVKAYDKS